jgi:ABC-2 type transport system ATP-binding protein
MSDKAGTLCKDLSKGQRQKVMLASAFIHEPRLLFLDEPFVNLDPIYQRKCRELLMEHIANGGTIFLCSHILEIAERLCTRVAVIDHGRVLAAGRMNELRDHENETLEDIFIRLVGKSIGEIEAENQIEEE